LPRTDGNDWQIVGCASWASASLIHAHIQKDFVYSPEGELLVDFIGRFENLDSDFQAICARIGVPAVLPHVNISNHVAYQHYYDSESEELIRQTFAPDISLFGYEF
jgi:hypothetical protein